MLKHPIPQICCALEHLIHLVVAAGPLGLLPDGAENMTLEGPTGHKRTNLKILKPSRL